MQLCINVNVNDAFSTVIQFKSSLIKYMLMNYY